MLLLDRFLLQSAETRDPALRLRKSLYLLILGLTILVEMLLAFSSVAIGLAGPLAVHTALALLVTGSLFLLKAHFHPWAYSIGFLIVAWTSSSASIFFGIGTAALFWHLILPTGFLIMQGERGGWLVLFADAVLAVVHTGFFLPNFHSLSQRLVAPFWVVTSWELGSLLLFLLFLVFLRLFRQTMKDYQAENGQALELLNQAKDSEARWADQARFLETLMDVIPFPLYQKGSDGRYLSANSSFRVVFEVQKEQVSG